MGRALVIIALAGLAAAFGCGREIPDMPDGRGAIVVTVTDTSGFCPGSVLGDSFPVDSARVSIESRTHIFTAGAVTREDGVAAFERLPTGNYSVFVRREVSVGPNRKVFTGVADVAVRGDGVASDTILVNTVSVSNLVINEILFGGSCATTFYFYDQFVELYNASTDTLYLDGIILTRHRSVIDPEMETKDYVTAIYAFQFPGTPVTGRQYPIDPGQFLVIAADAVNHQQWCSNAVDLSHADWETFNPLGNDYDVPSVPNLVSVIPGRTTDYLISLGKNGAVIATGEEYTIASEEGSTSNYMRIPINTVIDGVEWSPNPGLAKELTVRVDAGFAGIGVVKYSGMSTERREPGMDTNNSTFDFVTIPHATPGFFHAQRNRMSLW
jgi:hypothetical protein